MQPRSPHHGQVPGDTRRGKYHCERCVDFTPYDEREMDACCPDCGAALTVCVACGSQGFFCDTCGSPKSSKRVVWKP